MSAAPEGGQTSDATDAAAGTAEQAQGEGTADGNAQAAAGAPSGNGSSTTEVLAATKIQSIHRGRQARWETLPKSHTRSLKEDDEEEVESAMGGLVVKSHTRPLKDPDEEEVGVALGSLMVRSHTRPLKDEDEEEVFAALQSLRTRRSQEDVTAKPLTPVSPAGPAPWRRRPLKQAALELSADGEDEDLLWGSSIHGSSAQGAPRIAVTALRVSTSSERSKQQNAGTSQQLAIDQGSPSKHRPISAQKTRDVLCEDEKLAFSDRAIREAHLLDALPFREVTLNESGRVEIDGPQDMPGYAQTWQLMLEDLYHHDDVQEAAKIGMTEGEEEDRKMAAFEAWCEWQRRCKELQAVRDELREQALLGHISANLMGLVAAAGGNVTMTTPSNVSLGLGVGVGAASDQPVGNEPPPTPAVQRRRRKFADFDAGGSGGNLPVDQRYQNACTYVGLNAKPMVLRALRMVESGKESLPRDFCVQAYLGNRGAQALLLALASDFEEEKEQLSDLTELRTLDLSGHGMGNEAAESLCKLLPRCPRLQKVDLSRNHISEPGAHRLLEEVTLHPTLATVKLDQNPVPSWLRIRLKEVVKCRQKEFPEEEDDSKRNRMIQSPNEDSGADSLQ